MTLACSVILPYYKNRAALMCTLDALDAQTLAHTDYEVILVDDGSSDPELPQALAARGLRANLHYVSYPDNRGAAHARNAGLARARGEVLLFVDSDQVVKPDFLAQHLAFFAHVPAQQRVLQIGLRNDIVLDPAAIADPERNVSYIDPRFAVFEWYSENLQGLLGAWHLSFSHNFSIRRRDLQAIGGFDDQAFHGWGLEDCEFAYRLIRHGVKLAYNPTILAYHLAHPVSWNSADGYLAWNRNLDAFCALHPEPDVYAQSIFRDFFDPERRAARLRLGEQRPWLGCYRRFEQALRANAGIVAPVPDAARCVKPSSLAALRALLADAGAPAWTVLVPSSALDMICHVQLHEEGRHLRLFTY